MRHCKSLVLILALIIISCGSSDREKVEVNTNDFLQQQELCAEVANFNPVTIASSIAEEFDRNVTKNHELSEEMDRNIFEIEVPTNMSIEAIQPFFDLWEVSNDEVVLLSEWEYDEFSDGYDATYVYKEICEGNISVRIGMIGVGFSPSFGQVELWINEL